MAHGVKGDKPARPSFDQGHIVPEELDSAVNQAMLQIKSPYPEETSGAVRKNNSNHCVERAIVDSIASRLLTWERSSKCDPRLRRVSSLNTLTFRLHQSRAATEILNCRSSW